MSNKNMLHSVSEDDISSTADLRRVLIEEIKAVRAGKSTAHKARSIAQLASATMATVRIEMEFQKQGIRELPSLSLAESSVLPFTRAA
jgi:hypothetical protein